MTDSENDPARSSIATRVGCLIGGGFGGIVVPLLWVDSYYRSLSADGIVVEDLPGIFLTPIAAVISLVCGIVFGMGGLFIGKLLPKIRFSLITLLLIAFWIAAMMLVWVRREPWVLSDIPIASLPYSRFDTSPDGKRYVHASNKRVGIFHHPADTSKYSFENLAEILLPSTFKAEQSVVVYFVNDELIFTAGATTGPCAIYKRRFPEWWWGHLYRPEVWLAFALTVALLWRAAQARRSSRASNLIPGATAPPAVPAQRAELP